MVPRRCLLAIPLLTIAKTARSEEDLGTRLIDALEDVFGIIPTPRRAHAKGRLYDAVSVGLAIRFITPGGGRRLRGFPARGRRKRTGASRLGTIEVTAVSGDQAAKRRRTHGRLCGAEPTSANQ
jgi:hypothetical protein